MKQIKLLNLLIINFKKIKELEVEFNGSNLNLIGVNGSGKSTVFDAFTWVLFGKDSQNRSDSNKDFEIKPRTPDGQPIHNLETTVELKLLVDENEVVLKRVYKEVYSKQRGSEERELTGHTTDFYINGVPKKKSEYEDFIKNEILSEEMFKALTNVNHFPNLNWKEQRDILEKLATKTEMEIIEENPMLHPLKDEMIMGRNVEDVIKIQKDIQKKINDQLKTGIPSQLKALHEMKYPNLEEGYNDEANEKKLEESYNKLSDVENKLASGSNQAEINELENAKAQIERDITKVEREIDTLEFEAKSKKLKEIQNEKGKLAELEYSLRNLHDKKKTLEERIENGNKAISDLENKKNELYDEYDAIVNEEFKDTNCSYCGQTLPGDKLEEAQEHFNKHKSERLEKNIQIGKETATKIKEYQAAVDGFKKNIQELETQIGLKEREIEDTRNLINGLEEKEIEKSPEVIEKEQLIEKYKSRLQVFVSQIKKAKEKGSNDLFVSARNEIKNEIQFLNTKKAEYQFKLQNKEKIEKLEEEQKELLRKHEQAEFLIKLGEKFRLIRAEALQEEVNNNFELVKFQLFNQLINGGIEPTCVATYKGVMYPSCSTGEKINIGLDIINGLQKIYGVSAPIFIDNAEAVSNWLVESNSQLVKMFVDPDVKVLEIQVEEE